MHLGCCFWKYFSPPSQWRWCPSCSTWTLHYCVHCRRGSPYGPCRKKSPFVKEQYQNLWENGETDRWRDGEMGKGTDNNRAHYLSVERENSSPNVVNNLYSLSFSFAFAPHNPLIGPLGMVSMALTRAPLGSNLIFWYSKILLRDGNSPNKRFYTLGRARPATPLPATRSRRILWQISPRATWCCQGHFPPPRYHWGGQQQKRRCRRCLLDPFLWGNAEQKVCLDALPGSWAWRTYHIKAENTHTENV